jgi:hypothetical protein
LTLTPKGQSLNRRRKGTVEAAVRRTLDGMTGSDLAAASRLLRRLATQLAAESQK